MRQKGAAMASLRALAHKLQTALLYNGIKIKINQMQTYSDVVKLLAGLYSDGG